MPDDIEKRIRAVEDDSKEQRLLYKHMSETLDDIRDDIRKALDLKGLVDDHHGQLKKIWVKIDDCQKLREDFNVLRSEHVNCKPKVDIMCGASGTIEHRLKTVEEWQSRASDLVKGRVVSVTDKVMWVGLTVIAFAAVLFALKGYKV